MTCLLFGMDAATVSLCLAAITHTYLLFHCFPYIGYMAMDLLPPKEFAVHVTVDSVGWYAGLLGTAFTTGRCLGFVPWKTIRAKVGGVRNTLLISLGLSAVCSIWFGMSRSFASALVARFCLGLSNTLSGCVKRMAIDHTRHLAKISYQLEQEQATSTSSTSIRSGSSGEHQQHHHVHKEEMTTARVLAVMWWGSAIGPCLGGLLSNPGTFSRDTIFMPDQVERYYPFLLPNIVAAILCVLSMAGIVLFVDRKEEEVRGPPHPITQSAPSENSPLLQQQQQKQQLDIRTKHDLGRWEAFKFFWKSSNTRSHLLAYWTFSFVAVCVDEALPLFLIARMTGPGLSPMQIGWILSAGALMVVGSHTFGVERILSAEEDGIGLYPSLKIAAVMGNVPSVLVPIVLALNGGTYYYLKTVNNDSPLLMEAPSGDEPLGPPAYLHWGAFLFLALLTGVLGVFCSIYFSLIGVATGRTVPPDHRDEVARVMTLGALCARALAPVVAGILVSIFMSESWRFDTPAISLWAIIGLVLGLGAAAFTFPLREAADRSDSAANTMMTQRQSMYLDFRQRAHVFAKLWEVHYDKGSETLGAKWRRVARKSIPFNRLRSVSSNSLKKSDVTNSDAREEGVTGNISSKSNERAKWVDFILKPGVDPETVPFFILGTHKDDKSCMPHVLTPPLMKALHQHLPPSCAEDNFWLKYSLVRDGASIKTLESKIVASKNTILVVETLEGDVFGCFMAKPWQRTNKYEMSGESFLWRMKSQRSSAPISLDASFPSDEEVLDEIARKESNIDIHRWTGENNSCQLLSHRSIAAGGGMVDGGRDGFGFIVDDNLSRGSSSPCLTYGNPCLVSSEEGTFEVANMEVWAMTPFLFAADAEKAESTLRFIQGNALNARGDAASSAQSAWTSFL